MLNRAPKQGLSTRHVTASYSTSKVKPLPLELQTLPQRNDSRPIHPECATDITWRGKALTLSREYSEKDFKEGRGLVRTRQPYRVTDGEALEFFSQDLNYAMAFARAARVWGFKYEVLAI